MLNSGAKVGDRLILTKPIGTGILSTAIKGELADPAMEILITEIMATLNRVSANAVAQTIERGHQVHACTDITGFGLLGHLHEMILASGVSARLEADRIPLIPDCIDFINMGIIPEGAYSNRKFYSKWLHCREGACDTIEMALVDPQTSGGLLIAAPPEATDAILHTLRESDYELAFAEIGEIVAGEPGTVELI